LAEKRLIIVNSLLERFEPRFRPGRNKKASSITNYQKECKSFVTCISKLPDSTILVLVSGKITSKNPLFTELSTKAKVKTFPLLRGAKLRQWIRERVKKDAGSISPQATGLLAELVGCNLWIMANEIDKLTLFTAGRRIEEEDVKMVVSYAQQDSVFAMVDAILESKAGLAEQCLHQLLRIGANPAYLLTMLSRQVRMIVRVKELRNQKKPETEIRNKLGLTADFAWKKTIEQARRYPVEQIKNAYYKLLEADLSIKTGKYKNELALNILIAELCQHGKM
jgi:DNA polymerase-3 subunit delta